jgi:hypothetical protein
MLEELIAAIERVSWIIEDWYEAHEGEEDNDDLGYVLELFALLDGAKGQ